MRGNTCPTCTASGDGAVTTPSAYAAAHMGMGDLGGGCSSQEGAGALGMAKKHSYNQALRYGGLCLTCSIHLRNGRAP